MGDLKILKMEEIQAEGLKEQKIVRFPTFD